MAPTDPTAQRSTVTYQELADIESDFEDLNQELLLQQVVRERALYERRAGLLRRISGFWPLVFEQAPPEIDQYVQPADASLLLSSLEDIDVGRFDVADGKDGGDPRSFAVRFTFAENDVFEDRVLEKRFWHRHAPIKEAKSKEVAESWSGLVSEPVAIQWKKGKDLTGGLLDLAVKVYREGEASSSKDALVTELGKTAMGGISFFAWFGYVGRKVSAAESAAAAATKKEQRAARAAKRAAGETEEEGDDEAADEAADDDEDAYEYEIFPDGDVVALALAEDLWPNAIKYFRQAQEQEALSDADFESGDDDDEEEDDGDAPPSKKQRT